MNKLIGKLRSYLKKRPVLAERRFFWVSHFENNSRIPISVKNVVFYIFYYNVYASFNT
jgi:hypothetical protein